MNDLNKLGSTIKRLRTLRKMTQKELGTRCNISHVYICQLEKGHRSPGMEAVESISRELGIPTCLMLVLATGTSKKPRERGKWDVVIEACQMAVEQNLGE